jgi:rare lipoprotein A
MASYKPGNQRPDPSDGLPTGVMVAMNGPSPSAGLASALPGGAAHASPFALVAPPPGGVEAAAADTVLLPDFGPIVPQRPDAASPFAVAALSYADERVERAATAFAVLDGGPLSAGDVVRSWKKLNPAGISANRYVAAGSFDDEATARRIARDLAGFGKVEIERSALGGGARYSVNVYPDGRGDLDALLEAAWAHGAPDALAVRD